ncbi:hypothetical protein H0B56_21140 [Haloechinothrix sp. YIM 98757]|uniref:Uncharacterized protein n=1 Tax=Haloechinothrix aidingensis TaxID=2752311 RepID=A0A838AG21_9PSEU|nr:hypothetical protein [Haloechinothrix aidingensis]MBA0128058.1 hypothetical protein [Haloechinothrix aidingensis]
MADIKNVRWALVLGLGAFALIRPVLSMTGGMDALGTPLGPVLVTAVISVVWIAAVVLARVAEPVLTLVLTGLAYGVFAIVLSAALSPIVSGELQGPLATSFGFAVVPVLLVNALWGAVTGAIALVITGRRREQGQLR